MGWHTRAEGVEVALQIGAQVVEAGQQQVVLVPVVGVEGGASHVGAVEDVLNSDPVVALLRDQGDERLAKKALAAPDPAVLSRHLASSLPEQLSADVR